MKKLLFLLISVIMVLCSGCGSSEKVNSFAQYKDEPIVFENYQKYFLNEYCEEAYKFTDEYNELINKINSIISSKEYKPVKIVLEEKMLFNFGDTWRVTNINSDYYYIGEIKNDRPNGIGIIYSKDGAVDYKVCAGNFEDGELNGYGIQYNCLKHFFSNKANTFLNNSDTFTNYSKNKTSDVRKNEATKDDIKFLSKYYDLTGWDKKYYNYIIYEGEFKNGAREGKGNIYDYRDLVSWIDLGNNKALSNRKVELENKIKENAHEVKSLEYNARISPFSQELASQIINKVKNELDNDKKEYEELLEKYKAIVPTVNVSGRIFVMSGEFDNGKQDGKFICYTQDVNGGPGYKFLECDVERTKLVGEGTMWNAKNEVIQSGSASALTNKYISINDSAEIKVLSYPIQKIE